MILHRSLSSSTAATPPAEDDDFATGEFSGQLGKMLCQAASQMGIMIVILDPLQDCPASSVCHEHVVGSFNDGDTVREFAKRCGVLIVEIEHVDAVTLEKLEKQGVDCEPKASTIMIIQDRYRQKNHFSKFGIPLPDFMEVDTLHSIEEAGERFGYPLMVKSKRVPIKTQSLLGLDSLLSIVQD
ncbi:phosphoribosylaminoimidazole carboxylase, chloroplastic isoform X8 [Setaria viridis]|uniref:phosphoribosylaminoimidazole carboxylase, chloroplastic isoform X8 n=1 Tax=Setaria viridis TaxID=4556 RepID=UPI003B3BB563